MKSLVYKDLLYLKTSYKQYLFILILYTFIFLRMNEVFYTAMNIFIALNFTLTTLSYDNFNHWDRYALTMPIERKNIVYSKYLLLNISAVIVSLASVLVIVVYSYMTAGKVETELVTGSLFSALPIISLYHIMIFIVIKYGIEKMRVISAIIFGSFMIIMFLLKPLLSMAVPTSYSLENINFFRILILAALLSILIMFISIQASIRIVQNKEY